MLSIVIPTKNRGAFLERLLSYYSAQNLKEPLLVADSSDSDRIAEVRRAVDLGSKHLTIDYRSYDRRTTFDEKLTSVLGLVSTEFAVIGADDDFFSILGLQRAVDFLRANADFSVAHGSALTFELPPSAVYGDGMRIAHYAQRSIEHQTAAERLTDYLSRYSTLWYSVHRTAELLKNLRRVADLQTDPARFTELLPGCLAVIQGKAKNLEGLYMVRQVHIQPRGHPSFSDWVNNADWAPRRTRFETCVTEALAKKDKISADAARVIVEHAFESYVSQAREWNQRRMSRLSLSLKWLKAELARYVPRLPVLWQQGRSLLPGENNQVLLSALLRPSSPYHADFMPIYRAITQT
ncbi:MAG TPA: TIGR00180 family glycosyltransferase [Terriglobia bacterium]|nr:TIGR00180 family glycosyltransferase [Terriglobia bacterium]